MDLTIEIAHETGVRLVGRSALFAGDVYDVTLVFPQGSAPSDPSAVNVELYGPGIGDGLASLTGMSPVPSHRRAFTFVLNLNTAALEALYESMASSDSEGPYGAYFPPASPIGIRVWDSERTYVNAPVPLVLRLLDPVHFVSGDSVTGMTAAEKAKLRGIADGAEVNVQADWSESDPLSDAYIRNKPEVGAPSYVDGLVQALRAQVSSLTESKYDVSDAEAALADKLGRSEADALFAAKMDESDALEALADKLGRSEADALFAAKMDESDALEALADKLGRSEADALFAAKMDESDALEALAAKLDRSEADALFAGKFDISDAEALEGRVSGLERVVAGIAADLSDSEAELLAARVDALERDVSDAGAAISRKMDASDAEAALALRPMRSEVASGFGPWTVSPASVEGRALSVRREGGAWHLIADGLSAAQSQEPSDADGIGFTLVTGSSTYSVHAERLRYAPTRTSQVANDSGFLTDAALAPVRSRLDTLERQPEYAKARADWSESDESDPSFIMNRPDVAGMIRSATGPLMASENPLLRAARAAKSVPASFSDTDIGVLVRIPVPDAVYDWAGWGESGGAAYMDLDRTMTAADPGRVWWSFSAFTMAGTDGSGLERNLLTAYVGFDVTTGESVWCLRLKKGDASPTRPPFSWADRMWAAGAGTVTSLTGVFEALYGGSSAVLAFGPLSTTGADERSAPSSMGLGPDWSDGGGYSVTLLPDDYEHLAGSDGEMWRDVTVPVPSGAPAVYPAVYMDDLERLVGGAPAALDTLRELADLLAGSDSDAPASVLSRIAALEGRTVDSALSATSENPVQNKVVKAAIDAKCSLADVTALETAGWTWTSAGYIFINDGSDLPDHDDGNRYFTAEFGQGDGYQGDGTWKASLTFWEWDGNPDSPYYNEWGPDSLPLYAQGAEDASSLSFSDEYSNAATAVRIPGKNAHGLARLVDLPTKTSDLTNDGSDGEHPFLTSHQTWSDVKPSGGVPKTDMASAVQTSLGKADTAVQPSGIAGLMPKYDFVGATTPWFSGDLASDPTKYSLAWDDVDGEWELFYDGSKIKSGDDDDDTQGTVMELTFSGVGPNGGAVVAHRSVIINPYTVATYTADSTAATFEIAVGALPTGVTGKARDCILVIDCTATGAVAPTVTWDTHFHPRTDTATDLAIVEAGKRAVFYISEYAAGEFAVGGWVETEGGSGT